MALPYRGFARLIVASAWWRLLPLAAIVPSSCLGESPLERPDYERFSKEAADRFNDLAKRRGLVYERLAEFLVERFDLESRPGIGIDVGGGPGDLVFELAERTDRFYWIDADVNTWYAVPFHEEALRRDVSHRCGFVFADACALPFKDGFADLLVSRGSYQFWPDLEQGVKEAIRVLRPGGEAWIGRGFPPTMPEEEILALRTKGLVGGPNYDPDEDAARFKALAEKLKIRDFDVVRTKPEDQSANYGVWLRINRGVEE